MSQADKAVVLLSGGIDSSTALAIARNEGYACYALSFDYGQRHQVELQAAERVAKQLGAVDHAVIRFDLRRFGGSALTADIEVPKDSYNENANDIPITYVPARNTIFLSFALGWAEVLGAYDLFIGVTAVDYSGYPDCRPDFIRAFEQTANLGTRAGREGKRGFQVHTPLIDWHKKRIIRQGIELGLDYGLTHSATIRLPRGWPAVVAIAA